MTAEVFATVVATLLVFYMLWVGRPTTRTSVRKVSEPMRVDRYGLDRGCGLSKELAELDRLRAIQHQPDLFFMAVSKAAVRDERHRRFLLYDTDIDSIKSYAEREALKSALGIVQREVKP